MFSRRATGDGGARDARVTKSDQQWRQLLTPEQYRILRKHGTEPAFSSPLEKFDEAGTYHCGGCGAGLFSSSAKYHSGSGWPSFYQCFDRALATSADYRLIIPRTEIHCACCRGHLGHVFKDGPPPTGLRYCVNGGALAFVPGV